MNGGEALLTVTLARLDDDDVWTLRREWGGQCAVCDAGLPANCTCPMDDPRAIIVALADEMLRLRGTEPKETRVKFRVLVRDAGEFSVEAAKVGYIGADRDAAPVLIDSDGEIVAWLNPETTIAVVQHLAGGIDE